MNLPSNFSKNSQHQIHSFIHWIVLEMRINKTSLLCVCSSQKVWKLLSGIRMGGGRQHSNNYRTNSFLKEVTVNLPILTVPRDYFITLILVLYRRLFRSATKGRLKLYYLFSSAAYFLIRDLVNLKHYLTLHSQLRNSLICK